MDEIITKVTTWFNTEYQLDEVSSLSSSNSWKCLKIKIKLMFTYSTVSVCIYNIDNLWFLLQLEQFTASKQGDLEGAAGLSSLKAAIENTKSNVRWMNNNYGNVKTWLEQNREIVDQSLRS